MFRQFLTSLAALLSVSAVVSQSLDLQHELSQIKIKLDYLERRIDSLEQPVWKISSAPDRWEECNASGPCSCSNMVRTVNCWNLVSQSGLPLDQVVPLDTEILDLGRNPLRSIAPSAFSQLSHLKELSIFDAELEHVPRNAFHHLINLLQLKLSKNLLSFLEESMLAKATKLTHINVSMNRLSVVPEALFANNANLQSLQISHNLLRHIPQDIFVPLVHLEHLDLSYNQIQELGQCFRTLRSLISLDLSGNRLSSLDRSMFEGSYTLEQLDLSGNQISTLPEGTFTDLRRLRQLGLSRNVIKVLDSSVLPVSLASLDVSKNLIERVKLTGTLIAGSELSELNLSANNLEFGFVLPLTEHFPQLRELNLGDNLLRHFNESLDTSSSSGSLRKLYLHSNQISSLSPDVVKGFQVLMRLRLDSNLWLCNCRLKPLANFVAANREKVEYLERITCDAPEQLLDLNIVDAMEMSCEF